jgi:uncharacterized iron-regulated protein
MPFHNWLKILFIAVLLQISCHTVVFSSEQQSVLRLRDGNIISFAQMIKELKNTDIVFIGETHNVQPHHEFQLKVIQELHKLDIPASVGLEMFWADSQDDLNHWITGNMPLEDFLKVYYENWRFPWSLYRDIMLYIRDNEIPAVGLNVPPAITKKISRFGFSSLTEEEMSQLPPEAGCAVNEQYMSFIRRAYAMHGHTGKQFLYFCQAQILWDQVMAYNIMKHIRSNPETTMVVLAGNGHAWKSGIPAHIQSDSQQINMKVVLPEVPGHIDSQTITYDDADYIALQ